MRHPMHTRPAGLALVLLITAACGKQARESGSASDTTVAEPAGAADSTLGSMDSVHGAMAKKAGDSTATEGGRGAGSAIGAGKWKDSIKWKDSMVRKGSMNRKAGAMTIHDSTATDSNR